MRFQIDWASLIVGRKLTVFALFYFVFEGNFPSTSPRESYIWRGDLTEGFCITGLGGLYLEGLIHGGAYFRNFTVHGNEFEAAAKEKQKLTEIKNDRYKGGASEYHLAWALVKILTGRKGKEVPATLQSGMSRVRLLGVRRK